MMQHEQMEFFFDNGELNAPVSELYKNFIFSMLYENINNLEFKCLYPYHMKVIKNGIINSSLFKKTPKQFQEEVIDVLEWSFEQTYEFIKGEPYYFKKGEYIELPDEEPTKPQLRVVK